MLVLLSHTCWTVSGNIFLFFLFINLTIFIFECNIFLIVCILDPLLLCNFPLLFKAPLIHLSAVIMSNWEGVWKEREGEKAIEVNEALPMTAAHTSVCSCTSIIFPLLRIRKITHFPEHSMLKGNSYLHCREN